MNLPHLKFLLLSFLLFGSVVPAFCQHYSFKHYSVDDGLPTNAIYGGLQDKFGYIWFYSEKGISRFDGYEFRNYTVKDGLPVNDIFMMTEDDCGRLWMHCFSKKLVLIDSQRDSIRTITHNRKETYHSEKFEIYHDGKKVWFVDPTINKNLVSTCSAFDTIARNDPDFLKRSNSISGRQSRFYQISADKYLWFQKNDHKAFLCSRVETNSCDTISLSGLDDKISENLIEGKFVAYQSFQNGVFIRAGQDSLVFYLDFSKEQMHRVNLVKYFGSLPEFVRFYLQDEKIQIQTNLGLLILDQHLKLNDLFLPHLPEGIKIDRTFKDREGNIWVTSRQKGVYFLTAQERNAILIEPVNNNQDRAIKSIAASKTAIYAGTRKGNIYKFSKEETSLFPVFKGNVPKFNDAPEIKAIAIDSTLGFWFIRQSDGLYYYDLKNQDILSATQALGSATLLPSPFLEGFIHRNQITYLSTLGKDIHWDATNRQLILGRANYPFLWQFAPKKGASIQLLSNKRTYAIAKSKDGTIWLGHSDGLGSYKNNTYTFHKEVGLLDDVNIWDIEVDPQDIVWIGTDGFGLVAYNGKEAFLIAGTEGDIIQDVFVEDEKSIWIATNEGVKQIHKEVALNKSFVIKVLDTNTGLVTREANCVIADDQYIFVGTNDGLTRINRDLAFSDSTAPMLYLDRILVNGKVVPNSNILDLPHTQNEIEFHFTALSYKSFGQIKYEYQLTGADRHLQQTNNRIVRYSKLSPGAYSFHLKAIDTQAKVSRAIPAISVTIRPPWWLTPIAFVLEGLLVIALIGGIYFWRVRRIKKQALWETMIVKQIAELELQALQSQMNPHFVFNSLGAIQNFIQSNKKELADEYLASFGHLMRLFLESSKNKYISLEEEKTLLELYIQLEQMRFSNKFTYQFHIDDQINQFTTIIPSMLLQPFVENAINHGLFHKDGTGILSITIIAKNNNSIICAIEDNGIGRVQAKKIQELSNRNYKSRAMQITQERLNALREVEDYDVHFEIEDLYDQRGQASGTRVSIQIPDIE